MIPSPFFLLLVAGPTLAWALPPSAEPRVFIPTGTSAPEPYQWLNGGGFTGPPIPFHPDPLARYTWADTVNASKLQIFGLLPANVTLTLGTPPGTSFTNLSSLNTPSPYVAVTGFGGLQLDFGVNNAAWIEFDSPDLTPQDAASVTLGVSEYNEIEVTNLGYKVARPIPYPGATQSTYRLEISHPDGSGLYEGVRFGWLLVNSTPATPWHITGLRIVVQAKPTNWGGAFAAEGDDLLSTIWYTGAYTVKANLLGNQFGSILIYRGDRYSWGGDAHVAQATAMAALGNFAFVGQNLNFTRDNCNGIESYCLYVVLSVVDYFEATGDVTTVLALGDGHVAPKLEHAYTIWGTHIGSYEGWDDRLVSGGCFLPLFLHTFYHSPHPTQPHPTPPYPFHRALGLATPATRRMWPCTGTCPLQPGGAGQRCCVPWATPLVPPTMRGTQPSALPRCAPMPPGPWLVRSPRQRL